MPGKRRVSAAIVDGDLALRIAVVGVDADHLERPVVRRARDVDAVADRKLQAPGQLFADEAGIARTQAAPGVRGLIRAAARRSR